MTRYRVLVDDNYHYQDADERSEYGVFDTVAEALQACRAVVDRSLRELHQPEMAADELYAQYTMFGEDPFIVTDVGLAPRFSGREYARVRCDDICA